MIIKILAVGWFLFGISTLIIEPDNLSLWAAEFAACLGYIGWAWKWPT